MTKKKILVLSDHPLSPSGVGTQTKYFIEALLETGRYKFVCLGGAIKHNDYRPQKIDPYGEDWIIYPIDGTTNFVHGIPYVSVSIACIIKGKLEHAVVVEPFSHDEFTASRGSGTRLNGRRIRVSGKTEKEGALYATGIPFNDPSFKNMSEYLNCLYEFAENSRGVRRMGVASLDLAYVAAGRFDVFFEMYLKPWDIAAGALLVREAGGFVSDFEGGENFLSTGHVLASTPKLFKPSLQTISKHLSNLK